MLFPLPAAAASTGGGPGQSPNGGMCERVGGRRCLISGGDQSSPPAGGSRPETTTATGVDIYRRSVGSPALRAGERRRGTDTDASVEGSPSPMVWRSI